MGKTNRIFTRFLIVNSLGLIPVIIVINGLLAMPTFARVKFKTSPEQMSEAQLSFLSKKNNVITFSLEIPPSLLNEAYSSDVSSLPDWVATLMDDDGISITAGDLDVVKSVQTSSATNGSTVINGETITYTIIITNNSATEVATNIIVYDDLSENIPRLDISCSDCGGWITGTVITVTDFNGNTVDVIHYTKAITWLIPALAANSFTQTTFSINVSCQQNNTVLENQVFINYLQGGSPGVKSSNKTETSVRLPPTTSAGLVNQPSWCGNDVIGVYDLDWGDFDQDGYLDLVLASFNRTIGPGIYRNENSQLNKFHDASSTTWGTRWADFNDNGYLDLVSVGPDNGYRLQINNSGNSFTDQFIAGPDDSYRVEAGNFDSNSALEFVMNTYSSRLRLYKRTSVVPLTFDAGTLYTYPFGDPNTTAAGDYNNDGHLDIAIGTGPEIRIFKNSATGLTSTNVVTIDTSPLDAFFDDIAWGDYNRDGYLDLAATFNQAKTVQVYQNQSGSDTFVPVLSPPISVNDNAVRGLDWADFNGDGYLDLSIGDIPPRVYHNDGGSGSFSPQPSLPGSFFKSNDEIWGTRGADFDNDGDIDLSFINTRSPSLIFSNIAPFLSKTLTPTVTSFRANSVDWGDWNDDGVLDLAFGAGTSVFQSRIYINNGGSFASFSEFAGSSFGPHDVAFGDANGDGNVDLAIGTLADNYLYRNGNTSAPNWTATSPSNSVAWADSDLDNDGRLDLLTGSSQQNILFLNGGLQSTTSTPTWQSSEVDITQSVAWGYLDSDIFPDFVVGNDGQINRVYRNNGGKSFTPVNWTPSITNDLTRSVAWGDYDRDGDMDLAVGNYGEPNYIYENQNGTLSQTPIWSSTETALTTSLAWGDWNNDGASDLAVGNYGEKDQVYANLGSKGDPPNLVLLWESNEEQNTTDIAWGDMDKDGDLDLAVSQDGNGQNGVYVNTYVLASHHLGADFIKAMPLPQNPSYLYIPRPGVPGQVWSRTVPITNSANLTIPINFTVYDPDLSRQGCTTANGDQVKILKYEYSLNAGSTWHNANVTGSTPLGTIVAARCLGHLRNLTWQAGQNMQANNPNQPVSDNTRFRITVAHLNKTGPSQRATTNAVSPPFRVRNLSCVWPDNAVIAYQTPISAGASTAFTGTVSEGQGQVTFAWDFGTATTIQGQVVNHSFSTGGTHPITLTVTGPACPVARKVVAVANVTVSQGVTPTGIYLPIILKSGDGGGATGTTVEPETSVQPPRPTPEFEGPMFALNDAPGSPVQVTGLNANIQSGGTRLQWNPNPSPEAILGYRVYRSPVGWASFRLLADVPGDTTTYDDATATCGQSYFVTAYNAAGESLPSTVSYFSPPCR